MEREFIATGSMAHRVELRKKYQGTKAENKQSVIARRIAKLREKTAGTVRPLLKKQQTSAALLNEVLPQPLKLPKLERDSLNLLPEERIRADLNDVYQNDRKGYGSAKQELVNMNQEKAKNYQTLTALTHHFTAREKNMSFENRAESRADIVRKQKLGQELEIQVKQQKTKLAALKNQLKHPFQEQYALPPVLQPIQRPPGTKIWLLGAPAVEGPEYKPAVPYYGAFSDGGSPPVEGWLTSFPKSQEPQPTLTQVKGTTESWIITNAGCEFLNGKYMFAGYYDDVALFQSRTGMQLYRRDVTKNDELDALAAAKKSEVVVLDSDSDENVENVPTDKKDHPAFEGLLQDSTNYENHVRAGMIMSRIDGADSKRLARNRQKMNPDVESAVTWNVNIQEPKVGGKYVQARKDASAGLCHGWVLLHCKLKDCPRRHYYVTQVEREQMARWSQRYEAQLEMNVLRRIVEREQLLEETKLEGTKASDAYQLHTGKAKESDVRELLFLLEALRLVTVQVFEAILQWREHVEKSGWVSIEHSSAVSNDAPWSVSLTVQGKQLYGPSTGCDSKFKRFRRDADLVGKREKVVIYLGCVKDKVAAEFLYDSTIAIEARKRNVPVSQMPKRRAIFRSCGIHFSVESEEGGASVCEECKVRSYNKGASWTPSYIWNGVNYILKTTKDTNFLEEISPLKDFLGANFPLIGNVFLVPKSSAVVPSEASIPNINNSVEMETTFGVPQFSIGKSRYGLLKWNDLVTSKHIVRNPTTDDTFEILTMRRVLQAQKMLLHEEELHAVKHPSVESPVPQLLSANAAPEVQEYRIVSALYWDRCAAISIKQKRALLPFRKADIFCRPDAGEWKGLSVHGRHMLHYNFEENLKKQGKLLSEKREALVAKLRKHLKLPWGLFDPAAGQDLIVAARALRGPVVLAEANNLEKRINEWHAATKSCRVVQRLFRGMQGRTRAIQRQRWLRRAKAMRIVRETSCFSMAKSLWKSVVNTALQHATRAIRRPVYTMVKQMNHEEVIVTVYSLSHFNYFKFGKRAAICSSCNYPSRTFLYHVATQRFQVHVPPCTCTRFYPIEQLLIRAYNPLNGAIYRIILDHIAIAALVGQYHFEHQLPTDTILAKVSRLESVSTDALFGLRRMPRKRWEPAREALSAIKTGLDQAKSAAYLESIAEKLDAQFKTIQADASTKALEHAYLVRECERTLQNLNDAKVTEIRAIDNTRDRLAFSKKQLSNYFDTSLNAVQQSYDPLENASNIDVLRVKRDAFLECKRLATLYDHLRREVFRTEWESNYTLAISNNAQQIAHAATAQASQARNDANAFASISTLVIKMMHGAMKMICNTLTLSYSNSLPARRALRMHARYWFQNARTSNKVVHGHQFAPVCVRSYNLLCTQVIKVRPLTVKVDIPISDSTIVLIASVLMNSVDEGALLVVLYNPITSERHELHVERHLLKYLLPHENTEFNHSGEIMVIARAKKRLSDIWVAKKLLQLVTLDRWTGVLTIQKLTHARAFLSFSKRITCTQWWKDVLRGRSSMVDNLVFKGAAIISGIYCYVTVFESWGDLSFRVYNRVLKTSYQAYATCQQVLSALRNHFAEFRGWVHCIINGDYDTELLQGIVERNLNLINGNLVFTSSISKGKRCYCKSHQIDGKRVIVQIYKARVSDILITAFDISTSITYDLHVSLGALRRIPQCSGPAMLDQIVSRLSLRHSSEPLLSTEVPSAVIKRSINAFNTWIYRNRQNRNPATSISAMLLETWEQDADLSFYKNLFTEKLVLNESKNLNARFIRTIVLYLHHDLTYNVDIHRKGGQAILTLRPEEQEQMNIRKQTVDRKAMLVEDQLAKTRENFELCEQRTTIIPTCLHKLTQIRINVLRKVSLVLQQRVNIRRKNKMRLASYAQRVAEVVDTEKLASAMLARKAENLMEASGSGFLPTEYYCNYEGYTPSADLEVEEEDLPWSEVIYKTEVKMKAISLKLMVSTINGIDSLLLVQYYNSNRRTLFFEYTARPVDEEVVDPPTVNMEDMTEQILSTAGSRSQHDQILQTPNAVVEWILSGSEEFNTAAMVRSGLALQTPSFVNAFFDKLQATIHTAVFMQGRTRPSIDFYFTATAKDVQQNEEPPKLAIYISEDCSKKLIIEHHKLPFELPTFNESAVSVQVRSFLKVYWSPNGEKLNTRASAISSFNIYGQAVIIVDQLYPESGLFLHAIHQLNEKLMFDSSRLKTMDTWKKKSRARHSSVQLARPNFVAQMRIAIQPQLARTSPALDVLCISLHDVQTLNRHVGKDKLYDAIQDRIRIVNGKLQFDMMSLFQMSAIISNTLLRIKATYVPKPLGIMFEAVDSALSKSYNLHVGKYSLKAINAKFCLQMLPGRQDLLIPLGKALLPHLKLRKLNGVLAIVIEEPRRSTIAARSKIVSSPVVDVKTNADFDVVNNRRKRRSGLHRRIMVQLRNFEYTKMEISRTVLEWPCMMDEDARSTILRPILCELCTRDLLKLVDGFCIAERRARCVEEQIRIILSEFGYMVKEGEVGKMVGTLRGKRYNRAVIYDVLWWYVHLDKSALVVQKRR